MTGMADVPFISAPFSSEQSPRTAVGDESSSCPGREGTYLGGPQPPPRTTSQSEELLWELDGRHCPISADVS